MPDTSASSVNPFSVMSGPAPDAKELQFPTDRIIGDIVIRDWGSAVLSGFRMKWEDMGFRHLAKAQGQVKIPSGKEIRLSLAQGEDLGHADKVAVCMLTKYIFLSF